MSDDAELPESDNPFVVLGLDDDGDLDRRAVKRAYARLLRRFKPERDPESFQRLRAAYEAVLNIIAWRESAAEEEAPEVPLETATQHFDAAAGATRSAAEEPDAVEDEEPEEPDEAEVAEEAPATSRIWREYVENDRYDEAIAAFATAEGREPEAVWVYVERYAMEARREGAIDDAHAALARGILADAPVLPFVFARLAPPERVLLAGRPELTWGALRGRRDREHARYLFQERIEAYLSAGEIEAALHEVTDEGFRRDLVEDGFLRRVAQQVAVAANWYDPELANRVGDWAFDDEHADYFERIYLEKGFRRDDWKGQVFPDALDRFVSIYDALSPNGTKMAAIEFLAEVEAQPTAFAEVFLRLSLESSRSPLLDDMLAALDSLVHEEEDSDGEDLKARIAAAVAEADWEKQVPPKPPPLRRPLGAQFWLGLLALFISIFLIDYARRTGRPIARSAILFWIGVILMGRALYFRYRRGKAAPSEGQSADDGYIRAFVVATSLVASTGATPMDIASWVREQEEELRRSLPHRLRHVDRSRPIAFIARLVEIRRAVQGAPAEETA